MSSNKRDYERYSVITEPLSCKRSDLENAKIDIRNISCKGMKVCTNERILRGDIINMEVFMPQDDVPMFINGEVAWVIKDSDFENVYNAGIKFIDVNACDKERIIKYIDSNFVS